MKNIFRRRVEWIGALLTLALATIAVPRNLAAQDHQQYDDPPSRVARLGYMEGSVSFDPAGQQDWVEATPNRPMTTGDKLWADKDSRAELQLGSASIRLSANTGMSFLNLDDRTVQIQLTSGALNVRVRRLNRDDVFEIDTPNQAFSVYQPGSYRLEASEDGSYTVISVREGQGESTGNGQTFTLHRGQKGTFSGTETLNAEVDNIGEPDQFDNWAYQREHRYEGSRSAHYLSPDVVGYEDLDDNGDWRDDSNYGHVWFPNHVEADWAPYHNGHWAWVAPWGWTWVDDAPWGYAPFHYGRWVSVTGRWGWVAGPVDVAPVYAPALVVFVGGGVGVGVDVGWFPLGPREVYVPTYNVSREYVNRVNVSNTTVNTTTVTNVYNTTIINNNNNTNITNVNYVNRNVQGAVTAVPQRAFVSAQPVARAAVKMDARQMASAPVMTRVALAPSRESVLGARANTANHVTAPPAAVANRQVIAKNTPPPPPVPFAKQQQMMAAHPGVPPARQELRAAQPATTAQAHPMVKIAPPGKPTQPNTGNPGNQPGNQPNASRPGMPANQPPANQPGNRPGNQPAPNDRPGTTSPAQPNRPQPNRPPAAQPNNRPEPNQPNRPEANRPPAAQPNNRPEANQPNRPEANRPSAAQPNNRPEPNRPPAAQPNNRPEPNRPPVAQPNNRPEPNRPPAAQPNNRPEPNRPPVAQPNNRPEPNRPPVAQPNNRPEPNRPPVAQPNNRPEPNRPPVAQPNNRPEPNRPPVAQPNNRPEPNRPPAAQPNNRPEPNRPPAAQPNNQPEANRPAAAQPKPEPQRQQAAPQRTPPPAETRPAPQQQQHPQQKPETPQEKNKREQEQQKPPGI
jgi:hypothetical protein